MKVINPLQINDFDIKSFLKVILAVQLALWGAIGLDVVGLGIPILRPIIGFIYLTLVPGIIILRILNLHKLGNIETLLYAIGLSIATSMFMELFMNTAYPLFGVSGPISLVPLIITISIVVLILCVLSYVRDKNFSDPSFIDIKDVLSPLALFLCLIPFLSIFGTYLVNFHRNNILLLLLIVIISLVAILIAFDKFIPKKLYPLAVLMIAISILYHTSLISMYLVGWDICNEYFIHQLVMKNSYWDSSYPSTLNGMLSITMLPAIYSHLLNVDGVWVFKIIYPLLYSLVPLGMYRIFQKQTDDKIAFFSCFFFVSAPLFYTLMVALARQEIAELFLVLLILLMVDKGMKKINRASLSIVFGASLVVSHYALSHIYMFSLILVWPILVSMDSPTIQGLKNNLHAKFSKYKNREFINNPLSSINIAKDKTISSTFILLLIVFTLTWYIHTAGSTIFNSIVHIGDHIANTFSTDFLNPVAVEGLDSLKMEETTPLKKANEYLNVTFPFFIMVGIIKLLLKHREMKFEKEYAAFSYVMFGICIASITVAYFSTPLKSARLWHIALMFLAPFLVIGVITTFRVISRIVRVSWTNKSMEISLKALSVYFVIVLLFNTGFVYEVAEGYSGSISLSMKSMEKNTCDLGRRTIDVDYIYEQEVFSANWISKKVDRGVYAEYITCAHALLAYGMINNNLYLYNTTKIRTGRFLYLRRLNVVNDVIVFHDPKTSKPVIGNTTDISPRLEKMCEIYSNGGSEIYYCK